VEKMTDFSKTVKKAVSKKALYFSRFVCLFFAFMREIHGDAKRTNIVNVNLKWCRREGGKQLPLLSLMYNRERQ
jgi:hypothetical protein